MKKIVALLLALLMVGALMTACKGDIKETTAEETTAEKATEAAVATADSATPDSAPVASADVEAVQAKGKLIVGITEFEPMDYQKDGEWIGFDADMAREFAKSLGVEAEFIVIDWDNKILELNSGNIDCVWNGMTLTPEVTSAMSCTDPYFNNAQVVIVNKDVADQYQTAEACKDLSFAVESGSAGQQQAEANGFTFTEVADQATALMEVAAGTCDAAIVDYLMAAAMVGEGTSYAQLTYTASLNAEQYGVGFRQGSDLTAKCNEFFKAAMENGTFETVAKTYKLEGALIK